MDHFYIFKLGVGENRKIFCKKKNIFKGPKSAAINEKYEHLDAPNSDKIYDRSTKNTTEYIL